VQLVQESRGSSVFFSSSSSTSSSSFSSIASGGQQQQREEGDGVADFVTAAAKAFTEGKGSIHTMNRSETQEENREKAEVGVLVDCRSRPSVLGNHG
jgi:hypothetical protein